jgi:hypothetical protein
MSELGDLHNSAMKLASTAEVARRTGDEAAAQLLFREAWEFERKAALLVAFNQDAEPTRSVLFRSAASLALDCGETREAERLIAMALAGNPPDEIADELRDLYETATFRRHLEVTGTSLGQGEFQMSFSGNAVGFGIIDAKEYFPRIETVESLLLRTAERQQDIPFRERGRPEKSVTDNFALYLTVPRAASFAVTIRVGRPVKQKQLFTEEADIVFEFIECMTLFSTEQVEQLRSRIGDNAYYRNFVSQAKVLSPDGKRIRTVGFSANYNNTQREVALTSRPTEKWLPKPPKQGRTVNLIGVLAAAHKDEKRADRNLIGIRDEVGKSTTVVVPKGLMNDIVRPHWDTQVIATCIRIRNRYKLIDLRPYAESFPPQSD